MSLPSDEALDDHEVGRRDRALVALFDEPSFLETRLRSRERYPAALPGGYEARSERRRRRTLRILSGMMRALTMREH